LTPRAPTQLSGTFGHLSKLVPIRSSWTSDAPSRETRTAVEAAERDQVTCVEIEAAALYAHAAARRQQALCPAHMTNPLGGACEPTRNHTPTRRRSDPVAVKVDAASAA
jgi:hypothetical protein